MPLRILLFALCLPFVLAVAGCAATAPSVAGDSEIEGESGPTAARAKKPTVNIPEPRRKLATKALDAATLERIARKSLDAGRHETAAIFFSRSLEMDPERHSARLGLAEALIAIGNYPQAIGLYRDLLVKEPNNPVIRHNLGRSLIAMKREKEGLWYLENLIASKPNAAVLNDAGVAHQLLGDVRKAQDYFRRVQSLAPGDPNSRNNLAVSLALQGQYTSAERILYALARQPRSLPAVRTNLAVVAALANNKPLKRSKLVFLTMREPSGSVALAAASLPDMDRQAPVAQGKKPEREIARMFAGGNAAAGRPTGQGNAKGNQGRYRDRLMKGIARSVNSPRQRNDRTRVAAPAQGPGGMVTSFAATNRAAKPAIAERAKPLGVAAPAASKWRDGGYIVQLGAFEDRGNAEAAMNSVALRAPRVVGENPLTVEAKDTRTMGMMYRVRTARGTDRHGADALCGRFKALGLRCFVGTAR